MAKLLGRTALYYPTITIPTDSWLRQALLYWDQIASIVPQSLGEIAETYSPDIQFLIDCEQFYPIYPDKLVTDAYSEVENMEREFRDTVESEAFTRFLAPRDSWRVNALIHHDKVSQNIFEYLRDRGLAKQSSKDLYGYCEWFLFEHRVAFLYMSILAKYLADIEPQSIVTSTDVEKYKNLVYNPNSNTNSFTCLELKLNNLLPVPRKNVPLADIIAFKQNRRAELLRFRQEIDAFEKKLSSAENYAEMRELTQRFKESFELSMVDLQKALKDGGFATVLGSIHSLINLKTPTLWVAAGAIAINESLPWWAKVFSVGTIASVEVASKLVDNSSKKGSTLRNSAFAYLYHAQRLT